MYDSSDSQEGVTHEAQAKESQDHGRVYHTRLAALKANLQTWVIDKQPIQAGWKSPPGVGGRALEGEVLDPVSAEG